MGDGLFAEQSVVGTSEIQNAYGLTYAATLAWAQEIGVSQIGPGTYAWTRLDEAVLAKKLNAPVTRNGATPLPAPLHRIHFTVAEGARAIGSKPEAFRRMIERLAQKEGEELVARLSAGIVARKNVGSLKWCVFIPKELRTDLP